MMKHNYLVLATALAMGSSSASAGYIDLFTGTDWVEGVYSFDWLPGSSYTVGGVASQLTDGDILQTYVHGSLGGYINQNGNTITNTFGLNTDYEVTFVGVFDEVVFGINSVTNPVTNQVNESINFASIASPFSFYEIWLDTTPNSDPLTGTGYNDGVLISSGTILPGGGGNITSTFEFSGDVNNPISNDPADYGLLDQFGANNWGNVKTNTGIGGSQFEVLSDVVDNTYLLPYLDNAPAPGSQLTIDFNSSQKVAFSETNPSQSFFNGTTNVLADIGTINGINGNGVVLQVDGNSSFTTIPTPVPAPPALMLMLSGLAAFATVGRRAKKV